MLRQERADQTLLPTLHNKCPRLYVSGPASKRHLRVNGPRSLVPSGERYDGSSRTMHDPFDFCAVIREVVIRPERYARVLVGLAFQLSDIFASLASPEQLRTRRKVDLRNDAANDLALERSLAHVTGKPSGVLNDQPDLPCVFGNRHS